MQKIVFSIILIILIAAAIVGWRYFEQETEKTPPTETPPVQSIGNELEKADLIKITNPRPNQDISSPLSVEGQARGFWFFEASFPVKLFDADGFLLGIAPAQAQDEWMTEDFVPFNLSLPFAAPSTKKGLLILEKDNPSGLPEHADELRVPVLFEEARSLSEKKMPVKIFLSNSDFANEPYFDCGKTIAIEREVPENADALKSALEALLRGATDEETARGHINSINQGVRIQKLSVENGVAKADFSDQLEFQVGGSCRVAAIRAQITDTILQFPEIKSAVISINDRTEDILQP